MVEKFVTTCENETLNATVKSCIAVYFHFSFYASCLLFHAFSNFVVNYHYIKISFYDRIDVSEHIEIINVNNLIEHILLLLEI